MTTQLHLYLISLGALALMLTVVFVGSAGDAGAAPNLVANGSFDTDASLWTQGATTTLGWISSEDASAPQSATSGAGVVTRTTSAGDGTASQCVVLTGNFSYQLAGFHKQVPGGSGSQTASYDVTKFANNDCTGAFTTSPSGSQVSNGGWLPFSGTVIIAGGQLSVRIDLIVHGAAAGDGMYFDKIALSMGALDTPTATATNTPLPATSTPTATDTATPTNTATATNTPLPATNTPTATNTATVTNTATATNTPGGPTNTPTSTGTATATNTPGATNTPASTNTVGPTDTPTTAPTRIATVTLTPPPLPTNTSVPTATATEAAGPPPASSGDAASGDTTNGSDTTTGGAVAGAGDALINDDSAAALARNGLGALPNGQTSDGAPAEGAAGADGFPESGYGPQAHASGSVNAIATFTFIVALGMLGAGFSLQRRARRGRR